MKQSVKNVNDWWLQLSDDDAKKEYEKFRKDLLGYVVLRASLSMASSKAWDKFLSIETSRVKL